MGIGIDFEKNFRFKKVVGNKAWCDRIFLPAEQEYCGQSAQKYAGGFVAKEAVLKAVSQATGILIDYREIEVRRSKNMAPVVILHKKGLKVSVLVSITHTKEFAAAISLVI